VDTLGVRPLSEDGTTRRYAAGDGGPGTFVDVRTVGGFVRGAGGAGTVHHVAWRVAGDAEQLAVRQQVMAARLEPTPVIDRQYFHSVYFREPGGVLFEIATDPPGFAVDEPVDRLGERLMLPPQYEPYRSQLEALLPPIHLPVPSLEASIIGHTTGPEDVSEDALGFVHRYIPPVAGAEPAGSTTLVVLHGANGDENELIPLGRTLLPGTGILSPRGKQVERGMFRFFQAVAEGVVDQADLARGTDELARFIEAAATTYGLDRAGIVAVGFSHGANVAASLLLRRPGLLRGAVLLSPMVPFEPDALPNLAGTSVFIGGGRADPIAPPAQAERLAELLTQAGADVTLHWEPGGHALTQSEVEAARRWITQCLMSAQRTAPTSESRQVTDSL
jgi:predicted esterase